ncbi:MAG: TIGR03986 family CRISPR-associated RAMP protein [Fischerella sp. CENA71]|nr:TIGR03986 family CRISPR-associated RAMP protein [Fischerella sp. CENA71]
MLPRHLNNVPDNKKARAPYNFVELPNDIVEVKAESLPQHNVYYPESENRYTGRIKCTLTTESPLYIRCGLTKEEFASGAESKNLPDFFYTQPEFKDLKPVIPGSTLRGMTRSLIEIISFSKFTKVTNRKPFYRSLGDKALKEIYASNFIQESEATHPNNSSKKIPCYRSKVRAGFLKMKNNNYTIEECNYGRIDRSPSNKVIPNLVNKPNLPNKPLYQGAGAGKTPSWDYQNKTIYVQIDSKEIKYFFARKVNSNGKQRHPDLYLCFRKVHQASYEKTTGFLPGKLVITGDMQHKHLEFVFLDEKLKEYQVNEEIIRRFHDDDQITKWQEDAFPKDKPNQSREKNGYLQDGEPVFFLLNEDGESIHFLGRAQMFRLPYDLSPYDLIPDNLCDASVTDIAEAIFGYVDGQNRDKAHAGRVFFSDAICNQPGNVWYQGNFEKTLTPKILGSPKSTTFQNYLVQTSTQREELKHYSPQSDKDKTTIRGHKLYWHKGSNPDIEHPDGDSATGTQITKIKPIKPGVAFKFNIHFENLSDIELGAILWILKIAADPKYCLSLGMGKPLGMGAVKIEHQVLLNTRQERYSQLFNGNQWLTGEENQSNTASKSEDCINVFEKYITDNLHPDDHPEGYNAIKLDEIPRIQMLLLMLRCDNQPSADDTRYMTIEPNEYKERPVLPTPFQVMGVPEQDKRRFQSNSNANLPKLQKNIQAKLSQKFVEGQILDAKVSNIKGVEVTYQLLDGTKKTTKEHKKAAFLEEGQDVKVRITALKDDGSIKNVKYYE